METKNQPFVGSAQKSSLPPPASLIPKPFLVVRTLLGIFLLLAAGFKAHALWVDPAPTISLFSSPRWEVGLIELETVLGLWLLSGVSPVAAWVAALGVFALMAGISLYLGIMGQPSCGCFGKVSVNPWYTFALDVAAVAALWFYRPRIGLRNLLAGASWRSWLRPVGNLVLGTAILLAAGFVTLAMVGPSPSVALNRLRGESLVVSREVTDLGPLVRGTVREFQIQVRNQTDRSIRIEGGTADCAVSATDDLPLVVPPRGARNLRIRIALGGRPGPFQRAFVLFTDDKSQPRVIGRVAGRLVEELEGAAHQ
jgi:hypothetical protein